MSYEEAGVNFWVATGLRELALLMSLNGVGKRAYRVWIEAPIAEGAANFFIAICEMIEGWPAATGYMD